MARSRPGAGIDERRSILNRLRRLAGQVRGLQAMVRDRKACRDVLTQLMAAKSALNQVGLRVIAHTVKTCGDPERAPAELVSEALTRFLDYARPVSTPDPAPPSEVVALAAGPDSAVPPLLDSLLDRVTRLESLISADAECDEQLAAVMEAKAMLDQVSLHVIAHAMHSCFEPRPEAAADEVVDEAMDTFLRYISCVQ